MLPIMEASHDKVAGGLAARLAALGHPLRLRIVARLDEGPVHVSELARELEVSRPLLYMHLGKLEEAGYVVSELRIEGGRAMRYYTNSDFELILTPAWISASLRAGLPEDDEQ